MYKCASHCRFLCWFVTMNSKLFGIKPEVRGAENLKLNNPCVIVCNHQSALDLIGKRESEKRVRKKYCP